MRKRQSILYIKICKKIITLKEKGFDDGKIATATKQVIEKFNLDGIYKKYIEIVAKEGKAK